MSNRNTPKNNAISYSSYSTSSCHGRRDPGTSNLTDGIVNQSPARSASPTHSAVAPPAIPKRRESLPATRVPMSSGGVPGGSSEGASLSYGPVLKHPRHSFPSRSQQDGASTSGIGESAASGLNYAPASPQKQRHVFEDKFHQRDSFKLLRAFYEEKRFCDVKVQVGNKTFHCHKVVLACVSKYFRSMFQSDMMESRQSVANIKDIDEDAMKAIIDFAYTSRVSMDVDDVQNLLYASSILQVEAVATACCDFMKTQLDPQNCIGVRTFAEQHGRNDLVLKTDQYILAHFREVSASDEFLCITPQTLLALISSSDLNVRQETDAYEAAIRWVRHEPDKRKQYLSGLLSNCRLPLIPAAYLIEKICREELIRSTEACRDIIDEAKEYHMVVTQGVLKVQLKAVPRKSYAGVIFCVGGRGTSGDPFRSIECYDIRKDEWFTVADMSSKRRHVGVVSSAGRLFAVGGHDGVEHLGSGEIYDPRKNSWTPISAMTTLRRGLAVACLEGGPMYALGGLDDNTCYSTVERYDPDTNQWSPVTDMNFPRGGVAVAALKRFLYAVGGNDGAASLDSCERYDPHLNKWTVMAPMKKRRAGAGCAQLGGILYVVGGFDDNAPLDSVEKYDAESNSWTLVKKMSCPRGGVGVAALAGRIYAVGGHDGCNYLNSVESYDPVTDSWSAAGKISSCRAGAGVSFCDVHIADVLEGVSCSEKAPGLDLRVNSFV